MPWRIQLKSMATNGQWHDIRPANGDPYEFKTKTEAEKMLHNNYNDIIKGMYQNCHVRVVLIRGSQT